MKKLLLFSMVLLCSIYSKGQDNINYQKGQVYNNPVVDLSSNYKSLATVLNKKEASKWNSSKSKGMIFSTGSYSNGARSYMESPSIKLPALNNINGRINLYVKEQFELESNYDIGNILVSTDEGKSWQLVSSRSGSSYVRTTIVNLTSYAEKGIKLAFEMQADNSNTYKGWDVFELSIMHDVIADFSAPVLKNARSLKSATRSTTLTGDFTSIDARKFPESIFLTCNVEKNGTALKGLDNYNFFIKEYIDSINYVANVQKDNHFHVYESSSSDTNRSVDIVFLMDNSGSMYEERDSVAKNVGSFIDSLEARKFDYRLALCRFGQSASGGEPILHDNAGW